MEAMFKIYSTSHLSINAKRGIPIRTPGIFSFKRTVSRRSKRALAKNKLDGTNKIYVRRRGVEGELFSIGNTD